MMSKMPADNNIPLPASLLIGNIQAMMPMMRYAAASKIPVSPIIAILSESFVVNNPKTNNRNMPRHTKTAIFKLVII